MIQNFDEAWALHTDWRRGIFIEKVVDLPSTDCYFGVGKNYGYNNFAVPKIDRELDLVEIADVLPIPHSVYLNQQNSIPENLSKLVLKGYRHNGSDVFTVFDMKELDKHDLSDYSPVIQIDSENFESQYRELHAIAFGPVPYDPEIEFYFELVKKSVGNQGKLTDDVALDTKATLAGDKSACFSSMFYSQKLNFAYITMAYCMKDFSNKNYLDATIIAHLEQAKKLNIDRVYALSGYRDLWVALLTVGFKQLQEVKVFQKNYKS